MSISRIFGSFIFIWINSTAKFLNYLNIWSVTNRCRPYFKQATVLQNWHIPFHERLLTLSLIILNIYIKHHGLNFAVLRENSKLFIIFMYNITWWKSTASSNLLRLYAAASIRCCHIPRISCNLSFILSAPKCLRCTRSSPTATTDINCGSWLPISFSRACNKNTIIIIIIQYHSSIITLIRCWINNIKCVTFKLCNMNLTQHIIHNLYPTPI